MLGKHSYFIRNRIQGLTNRMIKAIEDANTKLAEEDVEHINIEYDSIDNGYESGNSLEDIDKNLLNLCYQP